MTVAESVRVLSSSYLRSFFLPRHNRVVDYAVVRTAVISIDGGALIRVAVSVYDREPFHKAVVCGLGSGGLK